MNKELVSIKYSDIIFDEGLYPRIAGHDPVRVQEYAKDIEQIEEGGHYVSVNRDNVLIDGRHRMLAYRKNAGTDDFELKVWRYEFQSPLETMRFAVNLQDKGRSLVEEDKAAAAKKLYGLGMKQADIAIALSVSRGRVSQFLARTVKEEKARARHECWELYLQCYTHREITERLGLPHVTVNDIIASLVESLTTKLSTKLSFSDDFQIPLYNVWKMQKKTDKTTHFGNTESTFFERLLYLYTKPLDIVIDPFGGSGSSLSVCRNRGRLCWIGDRKPEPEVENIIRTHDLVTDGLPPLGKRWHDVSLVYLDPPYWRQAQSEYSQDKTDLANMDLDEFHTQLEKIVNGFIKKMPDGSHVAMVMQPTQWRADNKEYTDHIAALRIKAPIAMRIQAPYESQQCNAQMVNWAKKSRQLLVLSREIVIWRIEKVSKKDLTGGQVG